MDGHWNQPLEDARGLNIHGKLAITKQAMSSDADGDPRREPPGKK